MGFIADIISATNKYQASENMPGGVGMNDYTGQIQNALSKDPYQAMQGGFLQQLQESMSGGGNSVSQNQLRQATDQNQQQAAGQVASVRGMNPAVAARLIANSKANLSQQAAGQASMLGAQEQVANRNQFLQGQQNATQRLGTLGSLQGTQNAQAIQNKLGVGQINAGVAGQNAATNQGIAGGILGGIAGGAASLLSGGAMAHGGKVPQYLNDGGVVLPPDLMGAATQYVKDTGFAKALMDAGSKLGKSMVAKPKDPFEAAIAAAPVVSEMQSPIQGMSAVNENQNPFGDMQVAAGGGRIMSKPMNLPGVGMATPQQPQAGGGLASVGLNPAAMAQISQSLAAMRKPQGKQMGVPPAQIPGGNQSMRVFARAEGGAVPGQASVPGDSYANDKVPAMLSPGEIVIPRSKANNPEAAKKFVEAIKEQGGGQKKGASYGEVLKANRDLQERLARLEQFACGGMVMAEGGKVPPKDEAPVSEETLAPFAQALLGKSAYEAKKKAKG